MAHPTPTPTPETAYLHRHSALIATNAKLRFALLSLTLVIFGLIVCLGALAHMFSHFKPLVIRINEVGHAEAVTYSDLEYKPQEAEMKYFLIDFLQKYYGRTRGTARQDFTRSLYFLTPDLANQRIASEKQSRSLDNFLLGLGDQIELQIDEVSIEDLRQQPYHATITASPPSTSPTRNALTRRHRRQANRPRFRRRRLTPS